MPERSPFMLRVQGREIRLSVGDYNIGRHRACELVLDDGSVSRHHAILRVTSDAVVIEDAGSRNGIKLEGTRVRGAQPLTHGASISIGAFEVTVLDDRKLRSDNSTTAEIRPHEGARRFDDKLGSDTEDG